MSYRYVAIGAGRQGTAAAYELALRGQASRVIMADRDERAARSAASRINRLSGSRTAVGMKLDIEDRQALDKVLREADACLSAVPYQFNLALTRAAIRTKTHLTDLGGNAAVVARQMELDERARKAGVSIVPDCGMGPGMIGSLAAYGIRKMDRARDVFIWDGGLPQNPKPPWNYRLTFHINGLTNEYFGEASFLRRGRVVKVPCFTERETVDFPPLGKLEAFVTSGGTSTAIRAYEGRLRTYQNKTLRYPGHFEQFRAYQLLRLFDLKPVSVGGQMVVPRDFFHALLEPQIKAGKGFKDIGLIRVIVNGRKNGKDRQLRIELIDRYDPKTGFMSMERLTGFHAAVMLEMAVRGRTKKGVLGLEEAVDPFEFVSEIKKIGFKITERFSLLPSGLKASTPKPE